MEINESQVLFLINRTNVEGHIFPTALKVDSEEKISIMKGHFQPKSFWFCELLCISPYKYIFYISYEI